MKRILYPFNQRREKGRSYHGHPIGNGNDLAGHIFGKTLDIELGLRGNACFELFDAMNVFSFAVRLEIRL
jgi:hypothetical protein